MRSRSNLCCETHKQFRSMHVHKNFNSSGVALIEFLSTEASSPMCIYYEGFFADDGEAAYFTVFYKKSRTFLAFFLRRQELSKNGTSSSVLNWLYVQRSVHRSLGVFNEMKLNQPLKHTK